MANCHNCDKEFFPGLSQKDPYCSKNCLIFDSIHQIIIEYAKNPDGETGDYINEIFDLFTFNIEKLKDRIEQQINALQELFSPQQIAEHITLTIKQELYK